MVEISDHQISAISLHRMLFFPFYKIALPDNISQMKCNYIFKASGYLQVGENPCSYLVQVTGMWPWTHNLRSLRGTQLWNATARTWPTWGGAEKRHRGRGAARVCFGAAWANVTKPCSLDCLLDLAQRSQTVSPAQRCLSLRWWNVCEAHRRQQPCEPGQVSQVLGANFLSLK